MVSMHSSSQSGKSRFSVNKQQNVGGEMICFTFMKFIFLSMGERICVAVLLHAVSSIRFAKWEEFQAPPTSRRDSFFVGFFC